MVPYLTVSYLALLQAGLVSRAVELAFRSQSSAAMQFISENLEETSDPQLLGHCAEFFISTSQFDRAVSLLATAGKVGLVQYLIII